MGIKPKIGDVIDWPITGLVLAIGITIGFGGSNWILSHSKNYTAPKNAVFVADLDRNGLPDMIVEQEDGYKKPLYGINDKDSDNIKYVSGNEMKRIYLERLKEIIKKKADYDGIESLLNKK